MTIAPLTQSHHPTIGPPARLHHDRWMMGIALTLTALAVSLAIHINDGNYDPSALWLLGCAFLTCIAGIALPAAAIGERAAKIAVTIFLEIGILLNVILVINSYPDDPSLTLFTCIIGAAVALCLLPMKWVKPVAVGVMLLAYLVCGARVISHEFDRRHMGIDVFQFQQESSAALLKGQNPYAHRFHSMYPRNTPYYGPGVVDEHNNITYGYPYPPDGLFMVAPAYALFGDIRYAHLFALAASAGLMAFARPGKIAALAAGLFLLGPRSLYVIGLAWTEPALLLNFSLAMFCACRWRRALPWALGLFFATKQYTVLSLPLVYLLTQDARPWREMLTMCVKAGLVVAATILPFFFWNMHEFWRAVVDWQFVQPFRMDALSYLVYLKRNRLMPSLFSRIDGRPPMWIPFAAVLPAVILSLWRGVRSPAAFAAGVTLVNFAFFALNKQAFCNYYFFVAATACWAVAALKPDASSAKALPSAAT